MNDQTEARAAPASTRRGRGCLLWVGACLAVLLVLLLVGYLFEPGAEAADAKAYPPPGELVDIGGYRLHINCTGSGSPTVVIDAGWGDWSTAWGFVQPEVAKTTRVCTYDRAGTGWSDAGPLPRDATQFAKELHTLLQNAHIPAPYVLAGHSLGGLPVRVFAGTYPAEVAGVVLIDSMTPQQFTPVPAAVQPQPDPQSQSLSLPAMWARVGVVRVLARTLGLVPSGAPDEEAAYARVVRTQNVQAYINEGEGMPAAGAEAGAVKTLGDLPLIVLTAKLNKMPNWQERQTGLLKLSSNSVQMFADSDHNIHFEAPHAAAAAIVQMVEQLRRKTESLGAVTRFFHRPCCQFGVARAGLQLKGKRAGIALHGLGQVFSQLRPAPRAQQAFLHGGADVVARDGSPAHTGRHAVGAGMGVASACLIRASNSC